MASVRKRSIVEHVSARCGIPFATAELVVDEFLLILSRTVHSGKRVEIRGFGVFNPYWEEHKRRHNPRTLEPVASPPLFKVRFRPGKFMYREWSEGQGDANIRKTRKAVKEENQGGC